MTSPYALAWSIISVSDAHGCPMLDQWMLSKPESARNWTHNGLKFMSIRSFMPREVELRSPRRARRRRREPAEYPLLQGRDMRPEFQNWRGPKQPARQ